MGCNSRGFIKRMLPFFATFAVGVFIASFFVSISGPNFRGPRFGKRHHEMNRLRHENEQLRNENLRLKNQVENQNWTVTEMPRTAHDEYWGRGPEFPVEAPPPSLRAPRATR